MAAQLALPLGLSVSVALTDFRGSSAQQAAAELTRLLAAPPPAWVLLRGPSGSGKSALLRAALGKAVGEGMSASLIDVAASLPEDIGGLDLVLVDNLSARFGTPAAEQQLFGLLNRLWDRRTRTVLALASHARPVWPDLATRLAWGAVIELQALPEAERWALFEERARAQGVEVSAAQLAYLQRYAPRDLTRLLGLLDEVDRIALERGRRVGLGHWREALAAWSARIDETS